MSSNSKITTDNKVIEKLGGVGHISKILNIKYTTVNNWKHRGIPAKAKVKFPQFFMPASIKDISKLTDDDRVIKK